MTRSKQLGMLAAILGLAVLAAQPSWGAEPGMMSGRIASVQPTENKLVVKTGLFASQELIVDANATITDVQQNPVALDSLRPGEEVRVEYAEEGGKRVARSITVTSPRAAPPAGAIPERAAEPSAEPSPSGIDADRGPGESPESVR